MKGIDPILVRIGVTSDIHVDITPTNQRAVPYLVGAAEEAELDVLIICGDVSPSLMHVARFLGAFESLPCAKFFIAGNHDIWVVAYDHVTSIQKYQAINAICDECGFHHLAVAPRIVKGIGFCGTIGWYDYSFRREKYEIPLERYEGKQWKDSIWQDKRYARWEMSDPEMADLCVTSLRQQFMQLPLSVSRIVVATHHVPFRKCVTYRNQLPWDFFSAFMGSQNLGDVCQTEPRVSHVVFGHTHHAMRCEVGPITAICSPIGYLFDVPRDGLRTYVQKRLTVFELS